MPRETFNGQNLKRRVQEVFSLGRINTLWFYSSRRTGQGSILKDEEYFKTKNSTFKPKALRNPNTYKNLESSLPDPKDKKKNNNSKAVEGLKPLGRAQRPQVKG